MTKQSPVADWPEKLNDQVAMLRLEPSELSARCGVYFEPSYDGLDDLMGAICHDEGQTFALIRYNNNPVPGTLIVLNEAAFDPKSGIAQLGPVLRALGATSEDVIWLKSENP